MVSLHEAIAPVVMLQYPKLYFQAGLKISESNVSETLAFIESKWKQAFPGYLYDYSFLDQSLEENYEKEAKTYTLFQIFSGISIFIGCMGLFGLVSFLVTQRAKEVGVRKVLGASVQNIVYLFSRDFVILIILAFIIAIPITWYGMEGWLADFAYKIDLSPTYFIIGISVTLFIALLTIGYQSIKAAIANPVNSLRSE
jgi:ABC-type antimicrobial peptide transport system permease subunit